MRKFTKEIAALIASAAVSVSVGAGSAYAEETVQTAGVDMAPEEVISSPIDEDVHVDGLMMDIPTETTMPPLAGEPMPPDDYIETTVTTTIPPLAGVTTTTTTTIPPLAGVITTTTTTIPPLSGTMIASTTDTEEMPPLAGIPMPPDETTETTKEEIPPLAGDLVLADGDINGDGKLNVADVVKLQQFISGKVTIDEKELIYADINGDGDVNVFDIVAIKRRLLGEISAPPAEINPESWLREKYPEYFDLTASKGLEVYVFQTAPDNYSCVLMEGTNRYKADEEIRALFSNSTSIDEMKAILSYYDIPEKDIFIIPWQDPVWEYAYTIDEAYCDKLKEMFFGKSETISPAGETVSPCFESNEITFISVSSWPESAVYIREYSSTEKIKKVVSYLNGLHLQKDFPENPDEYDGMTWKIRLGFENGDKKTVYFGNTFYCEEGSDWLKMDYDEAIAFGNLIYDYPSDL